MKRTDGEQMLKMKPQHRKQGNREHVLYVQCAVCIVRTLYSTCKWDRIVRTVVQYVLWCHTWTNNRYVCEIDKSVWIVVLVNIIYIYPSYIGYRITVFFFLLIVLEVILKKRICHMFCIQLYLDKKNNKLYWLIIYIILKKSL